MTTEHRELGGSTPPLTTPAHSSARESGRGPALGSVFPDLVLPDQTGTSVDLHASRAGRRALLVFHRSADW